MTRSERFANLLGVVVPFAGVLAAIVLLWNRAVDATDLAILLVMYVITGLGITVGFHRLLTHRAFQTYPWLERTFAVLGSLAVEGSVLDWVADHRKHHAHADKEGDPHSPHVGHGSGLRGLWHAHTGWLLETQGQADWKRYATELYEDKRMRRIGRRFPWLVVVSLAIPTIAGFVLDGFTLARCGPRLHLGRPGSDLPRPPRDLVGELDLPLLRAAAVRDRRPVDQRRVARRVLVRGVLASQPSRVPALGLPWPALVGDRPVGAVHLHAREGRTCVERCPHHPRAPAPEDRRVRPAPRTSAAAGPPLVVPSRCPTAVSRQLIRDAEPDDWEAIWPFFHEIVAAGETYAYDRDMDEAEGRRTWMVGPPGRTVVATDADGTVLGTANMYANRPGPGAHVASASFMVDPRHAGRGTGRALGEEVIAWARDSGFRAIQFNAVVETNERRGQALALARFRGTGDRSRGVRSPQARIRRPAHHASIPVMREHVRPSRSARPLDRAAACDEQIARPSAVQG